jgi:hypothetical protein
MSGIYQVYTIIINFLRFPDVSCDDFLLTLQESTNHDGQKPMDFKASESDLGL